MFHKGKSSEDQIKFIIDQYAYEPNKNRFKIRQKPFIILAHDHSLVHLNKNKTTPSQ